MKGFTAVAAIFVLSGCLSTSKPFPEKHYYALELHGTPGGDDPRPFGLRVSRLRVSSAYDGRGLTYRVSETGYETDYYNEFLKSPATLLTDAVRQRLQEGGRFDHVVSSSSVVSSRYVVEGVVNAMYGDLRDPERPIAVVHLQFFVLDTENEDRVVLQESYRETEACESDEPGEIVAGIQSGMNRAVGQLEAQIVGL